jgi:hypothetical protein
LHNEHFPCFFRNPFWQYQTTEVNNDTLIKKTDRTYSNLFINTINMYYLYLCLCTSAKCMSVELKQFEKVYLFIWSHDFRFSMSLSLSPNSLYRQTTDCTEGGGLTREHCTWKRGVLCYNWYVVLYVYVIITHFSLIFLILRVYFKTDYYINIQSSKLDKDTTCR